MQHERGLSLTARPASIPSMNNNSSSKEVISPNTSCSPNSAVKKGVGQNSITATSNSIPPIALVRSRTAPSSQGSPQFQPTQRERCNSGSQTPNARTLHSGENIGENDWEWQSSPSRHQQQQLLYNYNNSSEPDNQEQALFEQRLCADIYGVAVRKINQNGKSSLRYVKCLYLDASDVLLLGPNEESAIAQHHQHHSHHSSSRSVSSRHSRGSRGGFSRFLSGGGVNASSSSAAALDQDAHRSLLGSSAIDKANHLNQSSNNSSGNNNNVPYNGKIRVLTWGKKKEVTVPLDQFTAVRKGKVTDRSKRNPCPASRIVSLITTDIHSVEEQQKANYYPSLDIEAPTRLDRDKFARAFARFLNIPLLEEGDSTVADVIGKTTAHTILSMPSFPEQQYENSINHHQHLQGVPQHGYSADRSIRSVKSDMSPQSSWKGTESNFMFGLFCINFSLS